MTKHNVLFCINEGPDKVFIYSASAGIFIAEKMLTEDEAVNFLASYSRTIALYRRIGDAFSGLYLPSQESKDIREAAFQQYYQEARLEIDIE